MEAEIIAVGTELLLGQIVNTNATFLSQKLAELAIDVHFQSVVGDNLNRLLEVLKIATSRSHLIILCGGLGPTEDDLTKQAVATYLQRQLVLDQSVLANIKADFAIKGKIMTDNNQRQALIIEGSELLDNDNGLAVGCYCQVAEHTYVMLPGPPAELQKMVNEQLLPLLKRKIKREKYMQSRVLKLVGIGESQLADKLAPMISQQTNPTIAPYAKVGEVSLRLTATSLTEKGCLKLLDNLEGELRPQIDEYIYGYGDESLSQVVVNLLQQRRQTVACAESLTGGLLQATLAQSTGASKIFLGGFVTYNLDAKVNLLGLDRAMLENQGTVSRACVEQMAQHVCQKMQSDYGLSLSGVAGPESLEGQPVGTVWLALASAQGCVSEKVIFSGDRELICQRSVMYILKRLWEKIK